MTRRYVVLVGLLLGLLAYGLAVAPAWIWHPLGGLGYQLWSGIGSDVSEITVPVAIIAGTLTVHRFLHAHFECHEETCHRLGFHRVEGTPHRTCWHHHPVLSQHPRHGVPLRVIHERHAKANS